MTYDASGPWDCLGDSATLLKVGVRSIMCGDGHETANKCKSIQGC